ncbi:DUF2634 domain-containing protein [Paenibacillus sp. 7124]|uniref:DUF2634 domain-containing protein n=1 Tax=Paenibacillus apii TaxID=1850370 RepID=A0A6M1PLR3_9BACL|nr:DUF2634 domain-containing protein [Paenibacillus apii]NGM81281.1 DUF2634 domain-containing protein [Paenibacillus apii]
MFPDDDFTLEELESLSSVPQQMGKVFLFDFATKQFVLSNGRPVEASYEQAIAQWIQFVILANKAKIYEDTGFGLALNDLIGNQEMDRWTKEAELERLLQEKLVQHPEITAISDIAIDRDGDLTKVSMTVSTKRREINGDYLSKVVISNEPNEELIYTASVNNMQVYSSTPLLGSTITPNLRLVITI